MENYSFKLLLSNHKKFANFFMKDFVPITLEEQRIVNNSKKDRFIFPLTFLGLTILSKKIISKIVQFNQVTTNSKPKIQKFAKLRFLNLFLLYFLSYELGFRAYYFFLYSNCNLIRTRLTYETLNNKNRIEALKNNDNMLFDDYPFSSELSDEVFLKSREKVKSYFENRGNTSYFKAISNFKAIHKANQNLPNNSNNNKDKDQINQLFIEILNDKNKSKEEPSN